MTTPTNNPATFGGVGKLEFAPTNLPDDPSPTWVDITQYVETQSPGSAVEITRGRQSELNIVESSQLKCVLKNFDGRFTFGNTGGAYGSNWSPAKQVRYSVTLPSTGQQFVLFQGWIEYPDIPEWQPIGQMYVQLTALDRLTRLNRGRPFVSTLGAHIMGSAPAANLVGYWPLTDATAPYRSRAGTTGPLTPITSVNTGTIPSGLLGQAATAPPGDDVQGLAFNPTLTSSGNVGIDLRGTLSVTTSQTVTISVWVRLAAINAFAGSTVPIFVGDTTNPYGSGVSQLFMFLSSSGGGADAHIASNDTTIQFAQPYPTDAWRLITASVNFTTGAFTLWCGSDLTVSGTAAGAPSTATLNNIMVGTSWFGGSIAHVQLYVGATTMAYADHLAQFAVGMGGLAQQTTGQRITSILNYAGVPGAGRQIDGGQTFMNAAKLAGQTPLAALQNASGTERGRLFISGNGNVVFHDRVHVYNV